MPERRRELPEYLYQYFLDYTHKSARFYSENKYVAGLLKIFRNNILGYKRRRYARFVYLLDFSKIYLIEIRVGSRYRTIYRKQMDQQFWIESEREKAREFFGVKS